MNARRGGLIRAIAGRVNEQARRSIVSRLLSGIFKHPATAHPFLGFQSAQPTRDGYSSVRLRVFNFPRFVLLSNRRCFEPFVGFVALRFLRGMATL